MKVHVWRRCPNWGAETLSLETCPRGCKEPELRVGFKVAPQRLWLLRRGPDGAIAYYPPEHFAPKR
jgi:hypothetical protein